MLVDPIVENRGDRLGMDAQRINDWLLGRGWIKRRSVTPGRKTLSEETPVTQTVAQTNCFRPAILSNRWFIRDSHGGVSSPWVRRTNAGGDVLRSVADPPWRPQP